jgi:hypothetical protein
VADVARAGRRHRSVLRAVGQRVQPHPAGHRRHQDGPGARCRRARSLLSLACVRGGVRHLPATNPTPEPIRVHAERHHRRLEGWRARVGRHQGARTPADTGRCRAVSRVPRSRL